MVICMFLASAMIVKRKKFHVFESLIERIIASQ